MRFRSLLVTAKTVLIGVYLLTSVFTMAFAEPSDLNAMEQKLFDRTYANDAIEERLSRIEQVMFGQKQTGDTASRTTQLQSVFDVNQPAVAKQTRQTTPEPLVETHSLGPKDATDYPAVTELEQKVLGSAHKNEDVMSRLVRLEKQVFQKTFDELPLVDRVDQLTLKVFPDGVLAQEESTTPALPEKGTDLASSSLEVYSQLTTLEEQVFGQSFGGQMLTVRLARLEQKAFGAAKKGSVDNRMDKLMAWFQRQNVARNQQPAFPNQQQGSLYNVPRNGSGNKPYVPQVTMGQVMGSQGYSDEMRNLLPQQVQQQMSAAPSMPNKPVQVYKGPSNWSTQTEVIAPPPSQLPQRSYQMSPTPPLPPPYSIAQQRQQAYQANQQKMGYGPPMTVADFTRSLAYLETRVFGRAYDGGNIMQRLNNLEMQVFGAPNYQWPPAARMNALLQHFPLRQG